MNLEDNNTEFLKDLMARFGESSEPSVEKATPPPPAVTPKSNPVIPLKFIAVGVVILLLIVILIVVLLSHEDSDTQPVVQPKSTSEEMQTPVSNSDIHTTDTLKSIDEGLKDISGLPIEIDYIIDSIETKTDFVNYTKQRGTWGGGLELYWLDVTYKDNRYLMQVPFVYFKELDDKGIVPVKLELLRVGDATVISYMELDTALMREILKTLE